MSRRLLILAFVITLAPRSADAVEPDPLLPGDSQVVASVAVRQLLDAPVLKKHFTDALEDAVPRGRELTSLLKALGIDPLKDVDRLTLTGPLALDSEKMLLIVRGRFDPEKTASAAEDHAKKAPEALKLHKDGDRRFYEYREAKRNVPPIFFCVLDKETAVASPGKETVLEAAARKENRKPAPLSKELQALLAKADDKATVWTVGQIPADLKKRLAPTPEYRPVVDSLQHFRGSVTVGEGVKAEFVVQTNDGKAAVEIRKFMEGIKAILILAATNQDKKFGAVWGDLLAALKVANEGDAVTLKGQMTAEQIEKSVENSKKKP